MLRRVAGMSKLDFREKVSAVYSEEINPQVGLSCYSGVCGCGAIQIGVHDGEPPGRMSKSSKIGGKAGCKCDVCSSVLNSRCFRKQKAWPPIRNRWPGKFCGVFSQPGSQDNFFARPATRLPCARAIVSSASLGDLLPSGPARVPAPYGLPARTSDKSDSSGVE